MKEYVVVYAIQLIVVFSPGYYLLIAYRRSTKSDPFFISVVSGVFNLVKMISVADVVHF